MTIANPPVAGSTSDVTVAETAAADQQSQFYKSAVRFTRLYAMVSPTMVALLLAKKTRYGRFIPLPDALPDGFKLGKWNFNGTAAADETQAEGEGSAAATVDQPPAHTRAATVNGTAESAINGTAKAGVNGTAKAGVNGTAKAGVHGTAKAGVNGTTKAGASHVRKVRAVEYEVVHHVAGRARVRIPRLGHDAQFSQRLAAEVMDLPGVRRARVSQASQSLVVEYRPQPAGGNGAIVPQVVECIRVAAAADGTQLIAPAPAAAPSQKAALVPAAPRPQKAELVPAPTVQLMHAQTNPIRRMALPVISFGMGAGLLAGLALPVWLVGGTVLAAAVPMFRRSWQGISKEKRLTVDLLDTTTLVLLLTQANFIAPAFMTIVLQVSSIARDRTARTSRQANIDLLLSLEHRTTVERDCEQAERSWDEIKIGDVLLLYPGDQIPVDGLVLEGRALVDQHRNTGDSLPVLRETGDTVHAASLLLDGHLRVRAQRTGHETQAGQVVALLNARPDGDTRIVNYGRKMGNWSVVPTLLVGGAVFASSGNIARTTGLISMDLGTGVRFASPIAVLKAQTAAARRGILIRSGHALEMLAAVDVVIFDKTATLTLGRATVLHVQPLDDALDVRALLALASSAEQSMNHPIGEAIVRYAQDQDISQQPFTSWDYVAGQGVEAEIDGQVVRVGNDQLMLHGGIDVAGVPVDDPDSHLATATRVYVSRDDQLVGVIYCADPLRAESAEVIDSLQTSGLEILMLSGDRLAVAEAAAPKLGMAPEQVYGDLLPQDKVAAVQSLQASGRKVAVVGDGVNDAAAMAHADVSIALGGASDLARETADVVLVNDDLRDLLVAIEIAHHAKNLINQARVMVFVPNLGGIAFAAATVMNPAIGVIINNGSAFAAGLNSLRPFKGTDLVRNANGERLL